ncbi:hypothetical protein J4573_02325 [Actinomadura barringtoniae]|uniref:Beta-ketoacyl synthase-like N-terminal domain-containing protein n=1 Tax=Actinomadura barringtoniae TaxID=1427535 RepID=A0A939T7I5_9ACTN|nr:beta-ketoacyl synthase N-terminal-like domain-containing protein [Actinomadura barringtoniae]MBO2445915.1 hypothetical protein [Actinomadura barringtoniae]
MTSDVVVTGWGSQLPPFDPAAIVGRKGLRAKEPSTRLALCAAHAALRMPVGSLPPPPRKDHSTGVVVSSNTGNLDTVTSVVRTLRRGSLKDVSPLWAPNASSNVIAGTIAIRFGFAGPNLTVCNGATSGLDAIAAAADLIRAGRADRMIVVGVEPEDDTVRGLFAESAKGLRALPGMLDPDELDGSGAGAACVILETGEAADGGVGLLDSFDHASAGGASLMVKRLVAGCSAGPRLWLTGDQRWTGVRETVAAGLSLWPEAQRPSTVDLSGALGDLSGALGVFQIVAACQWLERHPLDSVLMTSGGSWGDDEAGVVIHGLPGG